MRRAWRRFWLCRGIDTLNATALIPRDNLCLRRRWHRGDHDWFRPTLGSTVAIVAPPPGTRLCPKNCGTWVSGPDALDANDTPHDCTRLWSYDGAPPPWWPGSVEEWHKQGTPSATEPVQ
jgi:hypothetical protein